jgi:sec-independent protein translocase protein TatB
MFDVGFSEILIIAVVALLVLGPERLPKAARFAGLWVRRARAQWYSVKAELERELANDELKRQLKAPLSELQPQMRALDKEIREEFSALGRLRVGLPGEPVASDAVVEPAPGQSQDAAADAVASEPGPTSTPASVNPPQAAP